MTRLNEMGKKPTTISENGITVTNSARSSKFLA